MVVLREKRMIRPNPVPPRANSSGVASAYGDFARPGPPTTSAAVAPTTLHCWPVKLQDNLTYWDNNQPYADDVIDLGLPRLSRRARQAEDQEQQTGQQAAQLRRRRTFNYQPNPRLYPGPEAKPKQRRKLAEGKQQGNTRKRKVLRRPVPNSRLYRPAPPRRRSPPPPPARPRAPWPKPESPRALETASRAALRLASRLSSTPPGLPHPPPSPPPVPQLSMAARPSKHSPDKDTTSAPSEFLAEFLSAIMRRDYAEALKYCQLILQYEPGNTTARGFYPLLQQRVRSAAEAPPSPPSRHSSPLQSPRVSPPCRRSPAPRISLDSDSDTETLSISPDAEPEEGQSDRSEGAWSAHSGHSAESLELESSLDERAVDNSDSSANAGVVSSSGSDDNGNPMPASGVTSVPRDSNHNASAGGDFGPSTTKAEQSQRYKDSAAASLRRLRAQFSHPPPD